MLEEAGWVTAAEDPSATRVASGSAGTRLQFTLTVAEAGVEAAAAVEIERQLSECGIDVLVEEVPAETLGRRIPGGPVFGGSFQAVLWAWPAWREVPCELFASSEIPSDASPQGANASALQQLGLRPGLHAGPAGRRRGGRVRCKPRARHRRSWRRSFLPCPCTSCRGSWPSRPGSAARRPTRRSQACSGLWRRMMRARGAPGASTGVPGDTRRSPAGPPVVDAWGE